MQYQILYDTQLWGVFHEKGKIITFPEGTDPSYIRRLLRDKVMIEVAESTKTANQSQESATDIEAKSEEQSDSQTDNTKSKKAKK